MPSLFELSVDEQSSDVRVVARPRVARLGDVFVDGWIRAVSFPVAAPEARGLATDRSDLPSMVGTNDDFSQPYDMVHEMVTRSLSLAPASTRELERPRIGTAW